MRVLCVCECNTPPPAGSDKTCKLPKSGKRVTSLLASLERLEKKKAVQLTRASSQVCDDDDDVYYMMCTRSAVMMMFTT